MADESDQTISDENVPLLPNIWESTTNTDDDEIEIAINFFTADMDDSMFLSSMLRIMVLTNMVSPLVMQDPVDPLDVAIQRSLDDYKMERKPDVNINVNSRRYDSDTTTCTSCAICTDDYTAPDHVTVLSCGHIFHTNCITEWGKYKPECPLCRQRIPVLQTTEKI